MAHPGKPTTRGQVTVLHVITGLRPGGAEGFLRRLTPVLHPLGISSHVVSLTDDGVHGVDLRRDGVPVDTVGVTSPVDLPVAAARLRRIVRGVGPDVVMTWLPHSDLIGGLVARSCGLPVIWNVRQSALGPAAPREHRVLERVDGALSVRIPQAIVCVSNRAKSDHVALGYPEHRMEVIHNGFDLARFAPSDLVRQEVRDELGVASDTPLIGHIARVDPQKDHATALRAFGQVVREVPDAVLLLCGEGTAASGPLDDLIEHSGLTPKIIRLGVRSDLERIDAALDVAISSSAYGEGLTNALGEAMACGVPCVATDSGDARELIGETGMVVPPADSSALSAAIVQVLRATPSPSPAARARIESHFSLERSVAAYAAVVERVVHV